MTNQNQKKQEHENGAFNPVVAGVAGAVIGAGAAVAGAVALSDKKNRDKVKEVLGNVRYQAQDYIEGMQKTSKVKNGKGVSKVAKLTDKVKSKGYKAAKNAKQAFASK